MNSQRPTQLISLTSTANTGQDSCRADTSLITYTLIYIFYAHFPFCGLASFQYSNYSHATPIFKLLSEYSYSQITDYTKTTPSLLLFSDYYNSQLLPFKTTLTLIILLEHSNFRTLLPIKWINQYYPPPTVRYW